MPSPSSSSGNGICREFAAITVELSGSTTDSIITSAELGFILIESGLPRLEHGLGGPGSRADRAAAAAGFENDVAHVVAKLLLKGKPTTGQHITSTAGK